MTDISRRRFLLSAGAGLAGVAATRFATPAMAADVAATAARRLPSPSASGIDHIVVLCMENR